MIRIFVTTVIVFLSATTVFYYQQTRHLQEIHELALVNAQDKLDRAENECQAKIARIRSHYETQMALKEVSAFPAGTGSIIDFLNTIKNKSQKNREDIIARAKGDLDLDDTTFAQFKQTLQEFENQKKRVLQLSKDEGKPFFDQRYLDMLQDHQHQAIASLQQIFTPGQMQKFQEIGLDQDLGVKSLNKE